MDISKMIESIAERLRGMGMAVDVRLAELNEIAECENALAAVTSNNFLFIFKHTAAELSELTLKRYSDYLRAATQMILDGKQQNDVLWHFELELMRLRGVCD